MGQGEQEPDRWSPLLGQLWQGPNILYIYVFNAWACLSSPKLSDSYLCIMHVYKYNIQCNIYIYIHIFSWLLLRLRIFTMFSTLVFLPPATQIHAGSLFEFPSRRGDEEEGGFCGGWRGVVLRVRVARWSWLVTALALQQFHIHFSTLQPYLFSQHNHMPRPRTKINGAKAYCLSLPETHVRRFRHPHQCEILQLCSVAIFVWVLNFGHSERLYILRRYAVLLSTSHFRCRKNLYDNEEEYWVVLKETGKRKEEQSFEEIHKRQKQAIPHI